MRRRRSWLLAVLVASGGAVGFAPAASAATSTFERDVLDAVRTAGFEQVLDGQGGPNAGPPWYPAIANEPQIDVTVFDLDSRNRVREAVNVLMSRDYPNGVLVPVGDDLSSEEIRYRTWDQDRWDGDGVNWEDPYDPATDVVEGREEASYEFMLPYPASVLKTMVAHGIMRLVDSGDLTLAETLDYPGSASSLCGGPATNTVGGWMEQMVTVSSNKATCALILRLHQLDEVDALNQHFDDIGLASLELEGTSPVDGGNWNPGQISMGSLDTAKLMYLNDGGPGTLWEADDGTPVSADVLSAGSRDFLKSLYARQGFNEVLSPTNWCGYELGSNFPNPSQAYPVQGIPTAAPAEFIQPDGTVVVDGIPYPESVLPCNDAAEVQFSHKTGLTYNFGADTGFVHALPGERRRDYVISVVTNLGNRYTDPVMNTSSVDPAGPFGCWTEWDVCYSESFARLGLAIDGALEARPQIDYADATATVGQPFSLAPSQAVVGATAEWSISPALPAGLSFDRATGAITGTPQEASAGREYEVEAVDDTGAGDTVLSLGVTASPEPPGGGSADISIQVKPKSLRIEEGVGARFTVKVANDGDAPAEGVKLCVKTPRAIEVRGGDCDRLGRTGAGDDERSKVKLDTEGAMAGSYEVRFRATGDNFARAKAKGLVKVR